MKQFLLKRATSLERIASLSVAVPSANGGVTHAMSKKIAGARGRSDARPIAGPPTTAGFWGLPSLPILI